MISMEVLEFTSMRSSGLSLCWQRGILRGSRPAMPSPCMYSFLPVGLDGGLVLPGMDCSATVNPWLQEQLPCIPVGVDVMCEQSLNAAILLKNHLVDFIIVCQLDALLIRVQQVLLTRRIGNKRILRACSYNSHTDWNQEVLHNKYHLIWWLCVYVHKVTGRQVKKCSTSRLQLSIACVFVEMLTSFIPGALGLWLPHRAPSSLQQTLAIVS